MPSSNDPTNAHSHYTPLDEGSRQLRLLKITNHGPDCLPHFALTTVSLDHEPTPTFNALSYQWGTDVAKFEITLNDTPFKIRKNLYDFLCTSSRIAKAAAGDAWFIDAICINQNDEDERASQVKLMGQVYSKAAEVVAWVGPITSDDERVLDGTMKYLPLLTAIQGPNEWRSNSPTNPISNPKARYNIACAHLVLSRSFWARLWIVQEMMLAQKVTFAIGSTELPPLLVYEWIKHQGARGSRSSVGYNRWSIGKLPLNDISNLRPAQILSRRLELGDTIRSQRPYRLYEAMVAFAFQDCYDTRDTVFGLLGLAKSSVVPDYQLGITELYMYVWLEGLRDISRGLCGSGYREPATSYGKDDPRELLAYNWNLACMAAFRISAQHMTVQLIVRTGYKIYKIPNTEKLVYCGLLLTHRKERQWATTKKLAMLYLYVNTIRQLLVYACGLYHVSLIWQFSVNAQCGALISGLLHLMRAGDWEMAMPDETVRPYSEWVREVERAAQLVENGQPPSAEVKTQIHGRFKRWRLVALQHIGFVVDVVYTLSICCGLAYCGAEFVNCFQTGRYGRMFTILTVVEVVEKLIKGIDQGL